MSLTLHRNRLRSLTKSCVSRFVALLILSSFAVALLPIVSTSAEESMPCCAGKSAEHCDSGLTAPKPRPVITEPMCGLDWTPPSHDVKAVTKPITDPVSVDSTSVEQDCQMDCGACAAVTSRHKRQKSFGADRVTDDAPATVTSRFDDSSSFHSSNENWTRINPRGPPARARA